MQLLMDLLSSLMQYTELALPKKMEKLEVSFTTNLEAFVIYALAALASLPKLSRLIFNV